MEIINTKILFYAFKYFFLLQLFHINYIFSLNFKEIYTNFADLKNLLNAQEDSSSVKPFTFLRDETNLIKNYIIATLEDEETPGDPNCLYFLSQIFQNFSLATYKFIQDSSHSLSKLGSYQDCRNKIYYNNSEDSNAGDYLNYTYILFYTPPTSPNPRPTLFSICVPEVTDCTQDEYIEILISFNLKTELFDSTQIAGVEAYIIDKDTKKVNNNFFIGLIVLAFFGFILLSEIFPSIPIFIFKCCFKKKIISENKNTKSKKNKNKDIEIYETSSLAGLEKSFDLKESIGEIYGVESNTGINNDSGISFLKGLRGICLMLFILGETLEAVYQYPVKKIERLYFNSNSLSFLYFFNRFTKNLFLSISSFSLCYKIICYFDNEIERKELKNINIKIDDIDPDLINSSDDKNEHQNDIKRKKSKKSQGKKSVGKSSNTSKSSDNLSGVNLRKINTNSSSSSLSSLSKSGKKSFSSGDLTKLPSMSEFNSFINETKLYHKISFKSLYMFLFRQFYKYILFVSILLIFRYSYYDFVSKFGDNPMWEFIKNSYVNKLKSKHIISMIFLYLPFYSKGNRDITYFPYDIVILEISLFILFSLVIFIIYKTNIRFDIILFVIFFIGIILKINLYFIILNNNKSIYEEYFYPSMGFTNKKWRFIFNNLFYYLPCSSIGIFFGLVNYAIQKSAKNIRDFKDKIYLKVPILFINLLKKAPILFSFIFSIIFIIMFIWCGLSYNILFLSEEKLIEDSLAAGFYKKDSINVYYSCDIDILIASIFLAIIPYNLIGENSFISFLKHEYWNILSKPYYSYMLIIQITGTNILYRINTNVELNLRSILFFSTINFIFGIVLGAILYTFFEVPLKKLNKFILTKKEENINEEEAEEEKDENNRIFNVEERAGSL